MTFIFAIAFIYIVAHGIHNHWGTGHWEYWYGHPSAGWEDEKPFDWNAPTENDKTNRT